MIIITHDIRFSLTNVLFLVSFSLNIEYALILATTFDLLFRLDISCLEVFNQL